MMQTQTQFESRHKAAAFARRALRCIASVMLMAFGSAAVDSQTTQAITPQYAGLGCTATIQNRAALIDGNGTYTVPNVPEVIGKYRMHITCPQPDGSTLAATSDPFVLSDGLGIPLLPLDVPTPGIQSLTMQVQSGQLNALGATAQLSVIGMRSDGAPLEETQASTGTTYISSNPAVATVGPDGLVTATGAGAVSITAGNDGLTATIMINSFASLDSDGDGMPDAWEIANGLNPYDPTDAAQDPDGDGLTNLQEYQLGTNPHVADTDGDGLSDGREVALGTNPLVADTDGDGLTDGQEVALGTNPLVADTDGDGIPDGVEVKIGTNPLVADATTSVAGHVTNPNGTPSAGTSVVVLTYFTTVTDSTGAFTVLHVPVTLGNVVASAEAVISGAVYSGASGSTAPISGGITDVGTIQLGQSSGQVSGTVYTPDNKPDVGAVVTVVSGMDTRTAVTNSNGVYTVSGLQSGTVAVAAIDPATSLRGQVTGTLVASAPLTLNVTLGGFGTVSGTVTDATGKTVGAGITVTIAGALNASTATDTLGHYSFAFVPLGSFLVDATDSAGNHGRTTGTVTATAQTINANVQFLGRGTVSGKVMDGTGAAVAGATVQLSNSSIFPQDLTTTADSVGQYSIANVFVGSLTLTATSTATSTAGTATASITTNGQAVTANIMLQATGTIAGTVYRANGTTPVGGAIVTVQGTALSATASASGTYAVPNVPLGTYGVRATDPASNDRGQASVTLSTAGQTVTRNISMVGVGAVKVTVVDGGGVATAGALVDINSNSPFYQAQSGVSGSDGTVTFSAEIAASITANARNPVNGLAGSSTVTLAAGSTANVTVTLQSAGTVRGTVYKKDAVTPVAGLTLILDDNQQTTTSAADGTYSFGNVVANTHTIAVFDAVGNRLAYNSSVVVSTQGQVVTANFIIVGRGTVTGHVTNPDGSAAQGVAVEVRSSGGSGGIYGTSTDVNGLYTAALVPVGGYLVVAQQHTATSNSYGSKNGSLPSDGATATTDVQLSTSLVPSTLSVNDANGESYPVRENGGLFDGSYSIFAGDGDANRGALLLTLTQGSTTVPFTGEDLAPVDLGGRQISLTQNGLVGLNVTRRVYVPADGYFARYIELLNNPGASDVTVGVTLTSNFRPIIADTLSGSSIQVAQDVPHVLLTTSGDNVINVNDPITPDTWATLGGIVDRDPFVSDPFADTPIPAVGYVFYGPGAAVKPSLIVYGPYYTGAFSTLTETYSSIKVPAGGTVALLHFISQQNMYAPANASAARLAQLPPEALAGIAPADLAAIQNFVMPANGTSTVAALPSITNEVTGHVYAADGVTPVPYANVRLQSTDPIFSRNYALNADGQGNFTFQGALGGLAIAPDPFSLVALEPNSATAQNSSCVQAGLLTGNGCGVLSPVYTGTFASGVNVAQKDIIFSNTGVIQGTVSRGPTVLNVAGTVTLTGGPMNTITVPVRSDGTFSFVDVLPGTYALLANVTNTLLTGTATSVVTAGQITTTNITIGGAGVISGLVTRPDGSLAVNATVNLRATGQNPLTTQVDTAGHYQFTDIPIGTYTLDCFDGTSNSSATATATVTANTTTTTNLALQSAGTVVGTVSANDGSSVANITVTLTSTTSSGTQSLSTTTNATGGFTFNNVKPGALTLHATNSDGLQGTSTGNLPLAGQTVTVNIALLAAGNLTGTVFLGDGTTPAAGVTVTLDPAPLTGTATTTTSGSGVYSFANVRLGNFTVYASNATTGDRGQSPGQIQANGQQRTINVNLTGFGSLTVKVLSANSTPVANSTVHVSAAYGTTFSGTTDVNGLVTFANVFASSYYVTAQDPATGYSSSTSGTLAYKATSTITVTLQSLANIQGTVFGVDGTTPAGGTKVTLTGSTNKTATTGADGTFQFNSVPTGYYSLYVVDSNNFTRASSGTFAVLTSGATVTQNLALVGVGSVTGTVTNTDGSVAENLPLTLTSQNTNVGGTYTATTGGDGTYRFPEVPVGKFTVTVGNLPAGQIGYGFGTLSVDGGTTVVDIQIQGNAITLPITLSDADGFGYKLYADGMFYNADALSPFYTAQPLVLTVGSTTQQFGQSASGGGVNTAAIQTLNGQGIELSAPVNGLNVTRKIYVPGDGYFARRLDVLQNTTSSPVTVTVQLGSTGSIERTVKNRVPVIVTTSNGNTTFDKTILWVVDDDDNGLLPYPQTQPAVATVFAGTGAAATLASASYTVASYNGGYPPNTYTQGYEYPVYKFNAVTIPANSTMSFLSFTAQEATDGTAISAAQRLEQLPPEALAGLSSSDLASVVNFVVPATQTLQPVHPPAAASISGHVLAGDGVTVVPNATVYLQSTDLQYGSGTSATADIGGAYSVPSLAASTFGGEALDPGTTVTSAMATGTFGATATPQTLDIPFTGTGILRGQVKTTGAQVISSGGASLSFNCPATTYCNAGQSLLADGTFNFLTIPAPSVNLYLNVYVGTGGYFYFSQSGLSTPPGQTTNYSVTLPVTGTVVGTVTNGDGSPSAGAGVYVGGTTNGYAISGKTDANGHYSLTGVPIGDYTVTAADPVTNNQVSKNATITQDTTTTVDLQFVGTGTVVATVKYANGNLAGGATVYLYVFTRPGSIYSSCYTDSTGVCTFTNVPAGSFSIRAYYPNQSFYTTTTSAALTTQGQTVNLPVTLTPVGTISGKVTYADGTPAALVYVYVADYQNNYNTGAQTDAAGTYAVFPVPADRLLDVNSTNTTNNTTGRTIKADAPNQQVAGDAQTLTVNLRYPGVADVAVTVLKKDGTPEAANSGYVYLKSADGTQSYNQNLGVGGTTTFKNVVEGSFVAYDVSYSNYTGFANGAKKFSLTPADDGTTRNITLQEGVTGTVQGTLYAADGTTPIIQNAYVRLLDIDTGLTNDAGVSGLTPPTYKLTQVSVGAGGFTLTPYYNYNAVTSLAVNGNITTQDQVVTQNFTLPVSAISGTVFLYDGVTPVPYANIDAKQVINGQTTYLDSTADANGKFQIVGEVTGDVIITVSDNSGVSTQKTVTLSSDTAVLNGVTISLPAVGSVMGTVFDENGAPVPNVNVDVSSTGGNNSFDTSVETDDTGSYIATDIPVGTITVIAYKADNSGSYPSVSGTLVNNGDVLTLNVGHAANSVGTVFGTVYDGNGDPAPDATVTLTPANSSATPLTTTTDDNGMYSVSTVPLGDLTVSALLSDGTDAGSTQGTLVSSDVSVEIDVGLQNPGIVNGNVYDASGNPVVDITVVVESTGDPNTGYYENTDPNGYFQFQVDQGAITVHVEDADGNNLGSAKGVLPFGGNLRIDVHEGTFASQVRGLQIRFNRQPLTASASLPMTGITPWLVTPSARSAGMKMQGGLRP